MSVEVSGLTKKFGSQYAVDHINFSAQKAQVVGFLGPNGAGKTSTMKMLTCFLSPSEGTAKICGFDILTHSLEVKKRIGYLPEHNPLYKDMYVREYLQSMAKLSGIPNVNQRIDQLIEMTGLTNERKKLIQSLSKGYRQRVGLSQALLHDPEVLILDEPTSGLDPNQLVDIRQLIRQIGKEKTLIFSTHIMQEVQALCDRVIIINKGKIVADDSIDLLQQKIAGQQIVHIEFAKEMQAELLQTALKGIQVKPVSKYAMTVYSGNSEDLRDELYRWSVLHHMPIREMTKDKSSVEDIFTLLTNQKNI